MRFALLSRAVFLACSLIAGCGGGQGSSVAPKTRTGAEAFNETSCPIREDRLAPLIVDWPSHQRGELEAHMRSGLAVVAYDCQTLRFLSDCRLDGEYGYVGLNKKEDVVQLEDLSEVRANLPLLGPKLVAGGELQRGSTVDIATVTVGRFRTTRARVRADELSGKCEGATHYVRGAHVGAFAMQSGAVGRMRAVAEVFAATADASASSRQLKRVVDGRLAQCDAASTSDGAPPSQCGALLRVQLTALSATKEDGAVPKGDTRNAEPAPENAANDDIACARAHVSVGGKCVPSSAATTPQAQCDASNAGGCLFLGKRHLYGQGVPRDAATAAKYLTIGCNGKIPEACRLLGDLHCDGDGVAKSDVRGVELYARACDAGLANACASLGYMHASGLGVPKSATRGKELSLVACNGGSAVGCYNHASLVDFEAKPERNPKATPFFARACRDGHAFSCWELGVRYREGWSVSKDLALAAQYFAKACDGDNGNACNDMGQAFGHGEGVPKDDVRALAFYERACNMKFATGCYNLAVVQKRGSGTPPNDVSAANNFEKACTLGEASACYWLAKLVQDGKVPQRATKVDDLLKKACAGGYAKACN